MTQISAKLVKELRDLTGVGMMDCKQALEENSGDIEKSVEWLRKKGLSKGAKKAGRIAAEGSVASYIHMGGKIGVLCEVNCESDFVGKSDAFKEFVHEICLQIAASKPEYVRREEVPESRLMKEKGLFEEEVRASGKPAAVVDKIVQGKLDKWFQEICLLEQPWVKEPKQTIESIRLGVVQKTGENVQIRRFVRFELGEGIEKKSENLAEEIAKMAAAVGGGAAN